MLYFWKDTKANISAFKFSFVTLYIYNAICQRLTWPEDHVNTVRFSYFLNLPTGRFESYDHKSQGASPVFQVRPVRRTMVKVASD